MTKQPIRKVTINKITQTLCPLVSSQVTMRACVFCFSKRKQSRFKHTLLSTRRRSISRARAARSERSQITVSSTPIDNRSGVFASLLSRFGFFEGHLKRNFINNIYMLSFYDSWINWISQGSITYEAIALGSAGGFIGDNDSFEDLAVLLKVFSHGFFRSLPSQSSHEHFGERGVSELITIVAVVVVYRHLRHYCKLVSDDWEFNRRSILYIYDEWQRGKLYLCCVHVKERDNRDRERRDGSFIEEERKEECVCGD